MTERDLPALLPSQYGGANELKRELVKAIRYATAHPHSAEVIAALLTEAAALAEAEVTAPEAGE